MARRGAGGGGFELGIGNMLLPSKGAFWSQGEAVFEGTFQGAVGCLQSMPGAAREAPGLRAGSGSPERSLQTWLLRMGTGVQPAAERTHSLASFPWMG